MTQTSPKPADLNTTNGYNPKSSVNSRIGSTTPDSKKLILDANSIEPALPSPELRHQSNRVFFWHWLGSSWANLSLRYKLTVLLVTVAAVPAIVTTYGIVKFAESYLLAKQEEQSLHSNLATLSDYVEHLEEFSRDDASRIATQLQESAIDPNNSKTISLQHPFLKTLLDSYGAESSFVILTNRQGRSVAQKIQVTTEDVSKYSPLPPAEQKDFETKYRLVSLPPGINLGDVPIVKNALSNQRLLVGAELLKGEVLQRLGLAQQAQINLRPQKTQGLPEPKQPFPKGTYDIDQGKTGLVIMAVQPLKINNQVVGAALVGTLLNRNYNIVDRVKHKFDIPLVTIFAQDWRISTNVPYTDDKTRAIGTRASREVADKVLNQGQVFSGVANIIGQDYLTTYSPLYDHQKELNPQAQPVGMTFVGTPLDEVESSLRKQQLIGYGIGGSLSLLFGLAAIPIAASFSRPLRRLADFAKQVGAREQRVQLEFTERRDEIGILVQELNQMADSIFTNEEFLQEQNRRKERYGRQSQLYADIASYRTAQSQDLEPIFKQAVEAAQEILKVDRVVVYLFTSEGKGYVAAESVLPGWPRAFERKNEEPAIGLQLLEAYKNGLVVPTNNVFEAGFDPEQLKSMERLRVKASLVTPILKNEQLFGLLIAHHCSAPHDWQQYEISFLTQLANQVGLVLDRVSLLQQKSAETERLRLLREITVRIGRSLDFEDVVNTAVAETRLALNTDRVVVYGLNEKWLKTIVAESVAPGWPRAMGATIDDPCFHQQYAERYRTGRVKATDNIYTAGLTACHLEQLEQFAVKANLVAPIIMGGNLLGLLIAHQCSGPRAWQQGEIDLFTQLAIQLGSALDLAILLEQQRQAKEQLQQRALALLQEVDPVSQGDLTIRASVTNDEIGTVADSYNATVGSLRKIVTQVQAAAQQVATTTSSNEVSVSELSVEALRQAEEIATALKRIQEMSDSIQAVALSAEQAEAMVQQATQTVEAGDAAMNRTVDGILAIRETVAETSKKVQRLGESSQKISKVVNLIGKFAAQTNLLALKASIEAARAGDEGRGFAVLAEEVRMLAGQSTEATAEIESLVATIQAETKEVATAMAAGTEQVVTGTKLVDETRDSLNKITAASAQISALVEAIAQATVTQSQTSAAVTQTITNVALSANKNSTEATLVSASFKELLAVAQQLEASVGQFKVS